MWETLKHYCNPADGRYEDLAEGTWYLNVFRDFTAGLIVAMIAIPLAMGLAIASGLKPEMGIIGGAIAGLVGAVFGGSKYQVYGPTAAFIPVIAGLMAVYGRVDAEKGINDFAAGHGMLVLASILSGVILIGLGLARLGRIIAMVPHSIVVGFTIGIACVIALSQVGETLGLPKKLDYAFLDKVQGIWAQIDHVNWYAVAMAVMTFAIISALLRVSIYIPGPIVALAVAVLLSSTVWSEAGLVLIKGRYGEIPSNLFKFTGPALPTVTFQVIFDLCYYVIAIVFVSGVESLLCSRMADRLAENKGTPFDPDKELWGQGWVQILVPLVNGFPHTGALARTAANIKLGAISPLAGIFKCFLKLGLAFYLASYLGQVPMACIGGLLVYVASGMVKPAEVTQVLRHNWFHIALMAWTAVMVVVTDFLIGVLSAVILYGVLHRFLDSPEPETEEKPEAPAAEPKPAGAGQAIPPPGPLFRRALVALHLTEQDATLLAYAGMLAREGVIGELHFVHVLPETELSKDPAQGAKLIARMKAETSGLGGGAPVSIPLEYDLLRGPLEDKLVEYAASAAVDLMLIGHRRNHPLRRSLARQLTKLAPSSILMVPEGSPATVRRILAPIDFSPPAANALGVAVKLAAAVGLKELTALHVYFDESRTTYEGADRTLRGDELAHFNAFVAPLDKQGVAIQPLFREGVHPAHTIGQVAQELAIDLTVMETRGRSPSAAILLGSVAEETLAESTNPVLVVKDSRKQIGLLRALLLKLTQSQPGM